MGERIDVRSSDRGARRQGVRFTIDPTVKVDVLDLLLELNHKVHREEQSGVRSGKPRKRAKSVLKPRTPGAPPATLEPAIDGGLFRLPGALF